MSRYPTSRAVATASSVSFAAIWKTPNPRIGIPTPLFRVTLGTRVLVAVLLRICPIAARTDLLALVQEIARPRQGSAA
jgi:hypothetical protein